MFVPVGEQIDVVNGECSALVLGGPGRGKTATALAAAARWLERTPRGRALFTSFSNAAVQRLATASGIGGGRFQFGTFHSVAMEVLKDYGRFAGLRLPARALDRMEERLVAAERGWPAPDSAEYGVALEAYARETGKVPFSLMIPLAERLLETSSVLRRVVSARHPFIVVDEFQDTTAEQWAFLKLIGTGSRVLALGDEHQMIYGAQLRATLGRFAEFEAWKSIERTHLTGRNFRCANTEILEFADDLLHGRRTAAAGTGLKFIGIYRKQIRARLASTWVKFRNNSPEGTRLAFLVPSARTGEQLMDALREPEKGHAIPISIRPSMERDEGRCDAFSLVAYAAADYVVARDAKALKQLAVALETCVALCSRKKTLAADVERLFGQKSRAASPVRDLLRSAGCETDPVALAPLILSAMEQDTNFDSAAKSIRRQGAPRISPCSQHDGSFFDGYRNSRAPRMEGHVPSRSRVTMLSMHRCKGREFDYVVMIVDPHAHRADADIEELRRLHYVAATRAKQGLAVIYASNDPGSVLAPVIPR